MPTAVVLQLGGAGVSGLVVGGGVSELGSDGSLRLVLADDGGDRGLPGLAVRELQQVGIVGGHGAASKPGLADSRRRRCFRLLLDRSVGWLVRSPTTVERDGAGRCVYRSRTRLLDVSRSCL